MKKMLTIKQLSEVTGLSQYEIRRGIKKGEYPCITVGNAQRKCLIDYDLFLEVLRQTQLNNISDSVNEPENSGNIVGYAKLRKI